MAPASARRPTTRTVVLDRALERLPLFRLSDSAGEEGALQFVPGAGARWRVLPAPGDRLPGTFDQDVYVGLLRLWGDAGHPEDGAVTFTLHAFLRLLGRRADGRTYEQLRASLTRLERTTLESTAAYGQPDAGGTVTPADLRFTLLASVVIERRRPAGAVDQLALFPELAAGEPGDARVVLAPALRANVAAGHVAALGWVRYQQLASPVARRVYRLLTALLPRGGAHEAPLERWAEQLPLAQRYPSHLQRVLQPAHEQLRTVGAVKSAAVEQRGREWWVRYEV
jgi:plasmid replication initiation protein